MDYGHKKADEALKKLEKLLKKKYSIASRQAYIKAKKYFDKFLEQDKIYAEKVESGEMSEREYKQWRIKTLTSSQEWRDLNNELAKQYIDVGLIAYGLITNHSFDMFALNYNYGTYEIEKALKVNLSFDIYNREAVEMLIKKNARILPNPTKNIERKIKSGELQRWEKKRINSIAAQSISQGDSIPKIAKRVTKDLGESNLHSAVRTARTMTTSAENMGRLQSYQEATEMGVKMKEVWAAVMDGRTRHSHRVVDGEQVEVGEKFSNGLRFPGDPEGEDEEVYNCRCSLESDILGSNFSKNFYEKRKNIEIDGMSYDEWVKAKPKPKKKK